jgi:hypothetical protein
VLCLSLFLIGISSRPYALVRRCLRLRNNAFDPSQDLQFVVYNAT